ncbi:MAG: PQQ-binding-like beta-propeller repeat protein [Planctomycetales bacterium]|nr:PQQ-binding-like beta-propeller repeat protein [Planctomycetales bacterium]
MTLGFETLFPFESPIVIQRLGWVLIHSLWQFAMIGFAGVVLSASLRRQSAKTRYYALLSSFLLVIVVPILTWGHVPPTHSKSRATLDLPNSPNTIVLPTNTGDRNLGNPTSASEMDLIQPGIPPNPQLEVPTAKTNVNATVKLHHESRRDRLSAAHSTLAPWLPTLVCIWFTGVFVFSLRPLLGWVHVWRLRTSGLLPLTEDIASILAKLSTRMRLTRPVQMMQSELVSAPLMVGGIRSLILLPATLTTNLPPQQLEAILAHELAHVQRYDYFVNIVQLLVETFFFYHPAVWWLSNQLRQEREHCCDDIAVSLTGDPIQYGRALLAIEECRGNHASLALSARDGVLLARIQRILGLPQDRASFSIGTFSITGLVVLLVFWNVWAMAKAPIQESRAEQLTDQTSTQWAMWGGSASRNNSSIATNLPTQWNIENGVNLRWSTKLGTASYSSPIVASGKILIGTNNSGKIARYPTPTDLACLQCFDQATGDFLWQFSSEKLPTGRVQDWPQVGLCSTPCVEGDRIWLTTNRCEIVCLDLNGFLDGENDGPVTDEVSTDPKEADVVWRFDMINQLDVSPLYQSCSSPLVIENLVLANTSNSPDESQQNIPSPEAPSFIALDKRSGSLIWQDASPGHNLLGNQCPSSIPSVAKIDDSFQAIFSAADGWIYAFDISAIQAGKSELLWKFDVNAKTAKYAVGSQGNRNVVMSAAIVNDQKVYLATGTNPERGEGPGVLWCIDPTKRGDLSEELVYNQAAPNQVIPHKRIQACEPEKGDFTRPNPNSGVIWKLTSQDSNGNGELEFEETIHRSCAAPTIHNGLLFLADYSGILHCLDANTGHRYWTHDLYAFVWSTPVVADSKVYVCDEDGDVAVFGCSLKKDFLHESNVGNVVCGTPAAIQDMLIINTQRELLALAFPIVSTASDFPSSANPVTPASDEGLSEHLPFRLPEHWIVDDMQWTQDDKQLVTVCLQGGVDVRRWNISDRTMVSEIKLTADQHGRHYRQGTARLSADSKRVVGATDAYVGVWDSQTGELLRKLEVPQKKLDIDRVTCLACSPDGSLVVAGLGSSRTSALVSHSYGIAWNTVSGAVLCQFTSPLGGDITKICMLNDGSRYLTLSQSQQLLMWDTSTGNLLRDFSAALSDWKNPDPAIIRNLLLTDLAVKPDGTTLAVASTYGIRLIKIDNGSLVRTIDAPFGNGSANIEFSHDGNLLARYGARKQKQSTPVVSIWSTESGQQQYELKASAHLLRFSDHGQLAIGYADFNEALSVWPDLSSTQALVAPPRIFLRVDRVEENTHSRGKSAQALADRWKPVWGDEQLGLEYGIARTVEKTEFQIGERIPMVAFLRNVSDHQLQIAFSPDMFGNPVKVFDPKSEFEPKMEAQKLLGTRAKYRSLLDPGETFGPLYLNIGLGSNPRPNQQYWTPFWPNPQSGTYHAMHQAQIFVAEPSVASSLEEEGWQAEIITTGQLELGVISP